jgi:hypothetical protein
VYTTFQTKAMICAAAQGNIIPLLVVTIHMPLMVALAAAEVGVETLIPHQTPSVVAVAMELSSFNTCLGNRRKL